jgi:hypothetical protein
VNRIIIRAEWAPDDSTLGQHRNDVRAVAYELQRYGVRGLRFEQLFDEDLTDRLVLVIDMWPGDPDGVDAPAVAGLEALNRHLPVDMRATLRVETQATPDPADEAIDWLWTRPE